MTVSILNMAEYVVSRRDNKRMSRQMLHSVLYFIQERYIEKEGEPLFKETFLKKGLFPCSAVLDAAFTNQGYIKQSELSEFRKKLNQRHRVVTKENRNNLNLPKGHFIDACVIASGGEKFKQLNWLFKKRRVAKQSRRLCKGVRGEKRLPTKKMFGFRRFDKVKYLKEICFIKGRRSSGAFVLMDINNNTVDFRDVGGKQNPSYKLLERLNARKSVLCIYQRV